MVEDQRRNGEVRGVIGEWKRKRVRRHRRQIPPMASASGGEVAPLQVQGDDGRRAAGPGEPDAEVSSDAARARPDVDDHEAASGRHAGEEPALERPRRAPRLLNEVQIAQRTDHLAVLETGVVEELLAGTPGRDEEAHAPPALTTSALFFEPKPMQLQSATLTSASRA